VNTPSTSRAGRSSPSSPRATAGGRCPGIAGNGDCRMTYVRWGGMAAVRVTNTMTARRIGTEAQDSEHDVALLPGDHTMPTTSNSGSSRSLQVWATNLCSSAITLRTRGQLITGTLTQIDTLRHDTLFALGTFDSTTNRQMWALSWCLPPALHLHSPRPSLGAVRIIRTAYLALETIPPLRICHETAYNRPAHEVVAERYLRS
jgi:hypothetical protein